MKANKAPDKLYVDTEDRLSDSILYGFTEKRKEDDIEYVRKEVIIEKVCKYLQENCTYTHPRKGTTTCAVNLTLLKEYLEDIV